MTYQVLARKWRPRSFAHFVGQEHVVRALSNALAQQRLHHAYLFTGTRGVGKTTLARIFAKCLNCETGVSAAPCGTCSTCQSIDAGRFIDLIEVDAASRTKVEDTRELLENVQYAPTQGRFKVYLIDEVHMLSGHSFNALLKTLEEPPPHIKFLLATTDPQKLPVTVLSRCLQFHLKNLPTAQISQHLQDVLQQEQLSFATEAIELIARAAKGSMRDALSLLDQAIAYGNGQVQTAEVQAMLGTIETQHLEEILLALAENSGASLLQIVARLAETGADFTQVLEELLTLLHQIAISQVVPDTATSATHAMAERFSGEEIQLFYQIGLHGRRDLPYAPTAQLGFEMTVLRMLAFRPLQFPLSTETASVTTVASNPSSTQSKPAVTIPKPAPTVTPVTNAAVATDNNWETLLPKLALTGPTRALASHCALVKLDEREAVLLLEPNQAPLLHDRHQQRIAAALSEYFQRPLQVRIDVGQAGSVASPAAQAQRQQAVRQASANETIHNDPKVNALLQQFNGVIVPESVKSNSE